MKVIVEFSLKVSNSTDEQEGKIRSCVLLLHTEVCHLTPHLVHYETLSDGLALVIVSEVCHMNDLGNI